MNDRRRPSPAYLRAIDEATQHHAISKTYSGKFLRPHAPFVKLLIDQHRAERVLDYGCGKGEQYNWVSHGGDASIPEGQTIEQFWGVPVFKFDPAYPPYAAPPPAGLLFGVTVITHVLGSIPIPDLLAWVMPGVRERTTGAVYIAEKLGPVQKDVFGDTSNLPRWTEGEWRGFVRGQSLTDRDLQFVLSLRRREGDATLVERWSYQAGEEAAWPSQT